MLALAIAGLVITALIAFPVVTNSQYLLAMAGEDTVFGRYFPEMGKWVSLAVRGIQDTEASYPFLFYMSDWMVFAHLVVAAFLYGAFIEPARNVWIIQVSIWTCLAVIPFALIAGEVRHIPLFWRLIDCSFGVICIVPLYFSLRWLTRYG